MGQNSSRPVSRASGTGAASSSSSTAADSPSPTPAHGYRHNTLTASVRQRFAWGRRSSSSPSVSSSGTLPISATSSNRPSFLARVKRSASRSDDGDKPRAKTKRRRRATWVAALSPNRDAAWTDDASAPFEPPVPPAPSTQQSEPLDVEPGPSLSQEPSPEPDLDKPAPDSDVLGTVPTTDSDSASAPVPRPATPMPPSSPPPATETVSPTSPPMAPSPASASATEPDSLLTERDAARELIESILDLRRNADWARNSRRSIGGGGGRSDETEASETGRDRRESMADTAERVAAVVQGPTRRILVQGVVQSTTMTVEAANLQAARESSSASSEPAGGDPTSTARGEDPNEGISGTVFTPTVDDDDAASSRSSGSSATVTPSISTVTNSRAEAAVVEEQASLIGRLLSVAAAATAASLLPGRLNLDGSETEAGPPSTAGPRAVVDDRAGEGGRSRGGGNGGEAGLQATLRQALRNAFGDGTVRRQQRREGSATTTTTSTDRVEGAGTASGEVDGPTQDTDGSQVVGVATSSRPDASNGSSSGSRLISALLRAAGPRLPTTQPPAAPDVVAEDRTDPVSDEPVSTREPTSFQTFLGDLEGQVRNEIVAMMAEEARAAAAADGRSTSSDPFSFVRMHAWPANAGSGDAGAGHGAAGGVPADAPARGVERASSGEEGADGDGEGDGASRPTRPEMVPALVVGVRSALSEARAESTESQSNPRASNGEGGRESASNGDGGGESATEGGQRTGGPSEGSSRSWLIFVLAGIYPSTHPIFIHPHLFVPGGLTSGTLDYETMLRLAELIGQHKPPTTSQGDIDKAGLRIIHKHEIEGAMKETEVLANTTERCLVCLEDYEDEEELRLLGCKHLFHRACVDQWLTTGRNSCPACREAGVKSASPPDAPTSPTPNQDPPVEVQAAA